MGFNREKKERKELREAIVCRKAQYGELASPRI